MSHSKIKCASDASFKCLKFEERALNSSYVSILNTLKCIELNTTLAEFETKRREEADSLSNAHNVIWQSIDQIHRSISSAEKIKKLDVGSCEQHLQELYNQISNYKEYVRSRLTILKKNRTTLEEEVNSIEQLCVKFDSANFYKSYNTSPMIGVKVIKNSTSMTNKDVEKFQEFLYRNGGHTGGWGEEEQKIFLKCWYKYHSHIFNNREMRKNNWQNGYFDSNERLFVDDVQRLIPDKSAEDISAHIIWMHKYNDLKEQQMDAINNWKSLREANKYHRKILDYVQTKPLKSSSQIIAQTHDVKDEIKEWQSKKEMEQKLESERRAEVFIEEKESDQLKNQSRKKEKEIISLWIEEKRSEEENARRLQEEKLSHETRLKTLNANKKIKEYRQRDQSFISDRISTIKNRRNTKSMNSLLDINALRRRNDKLNIDNKGLRGGYTANTKQWCYRIMKNNSSDEYSKIHAIDHIPKLKTPQWRQGLTIR